MLLNPFSFNSASVTESTSIDDESVELAGVCDTRDRISAVPLSVVRTFGSEDDDEAFDFIVKCLVVTGNRRLEVVREGVNREEWCLGRVMLDEGVKK